MQPFKKSLLLPLALVLLNTSCAMLGERELQLIEEGAIKDAKLAPEAVHLAYLQCYPFPDYKKRDCQQAISNLPIARKAASTWEYIRAYEMEAEKQGFTAFLKNEGKFCQSILEKPKYSKAYGSFIVECTNGHSYFMSFDQEREKWMISLTKSL